MRAYRYVPAVLFVMTSLSLGQSAFAADLVISPAASRTTFSSDVGMLVEKAFPKYEDQALAQRLQVAARTLQLRADGIKVRNLRAIEQTMGFQAGGSTAPAGEVDNASAYYRVLPMMGKAFATHKNDTALGSSREMFRGMEATIKKNQTLFLARLGIPADEIMKTSFRKVMVQSMKADSPNNSDGTPAMVRRGVTTVHRGFQGFPIEESAARATSFNAQRIESFSLQWPKFVLHPSLTAISLATPAVLKRTIADTVKKSLPESGEVAVYMGVVFRPAMSDAGQLIHLPAMKVIVTPKARSIAGAEGRTLTEGGAVFFADIVKNSPPIRSTDQPDPNTGPL